MRTVWHTPEQLKVRLHSLWHRGGESSAEGNLLDFQIWFFCISVSKWRSRLLALFRNVAILQCTACTHLYWLLFHYLDHIQILILLLYSLFSLSICPFHCLHHFIINIISTLTTTLWDPKISLDLRVIVLILEQKQSVTMCSLLHNIWQTVQCIWHWIIWRKVDLKDRQTGGQRRTSDYFLTRVYYDCFRSHLWGESCCSPGIKSTRERR